MFFRNNFKFLVIFLLINKYVNGAHILGLMGCASPSHSIWNTVLINGLADKGHKLTVLTADFPQNSKDIPKNVKYFHLEETYNAIHSDMDLNDFIGISLRDLVITFCDYSIENCKGNLNSKGLKSFLQEYDENFKFDLIVHDFTVGPCLLGLMDRFKNPPLVGITAFPYPAFGIELSGGHYHPAYVNFHSASFNPVKSFWDRLQNHFIYAFEVLYRKYIFTPGMDKLVREFFFKNISYLGDIEKRTTLVLVNSHPAITAAEPLPPNVIEVGGLQLLDPQPLPKDIEDFVKLSKKGTILFSLGTNMRPEDVSQEHAAKFLQLIERFPDYHFLWKFDVKFLKSKIPKNVLIKKFFPQRDILGDKRTKAFITHAGGLSTQESIWYGVPMIGLALFADQIRNIQKSIQLGVATQADFLTMETETLYQAVKEVLDNKTYAENIKLVSTRFRDRPMKPLDTAVWWIEYILRDPNPDHLRSPTLELGFFVANSLDIVLIVVAIFSIVVVFILSLIYCICCRTSKKEAKTKLKRN